MELQFTVGEAISSAAVGTSSGAARDPWTCTEEEYSPPQSMNLVRTINIIMTAIVMVNF